jgi:hypothetical protein
MNTCFGKTCYEEEAIVRFLQMVKNNLMKGLGIGF